MFTLRFSHTLLTATDLLANPDVSLFSEYQQTAIRFCHAWLAGQQQFTLHTSGSTGTPKPVAVSRTHMQASAALTRDALGLQAGNTALVCLNIRYIAGIMMLVRGMEIGMHLTLIEPDSHPLHSLPENTTFDFLSFVPLQMQHSLEKTTVLNAAKAIILGGAALSQTLEEHLQSVQAPIFHTYGMTETVSHIALRRVNGSQKSTLFTVLAGIRIRTDDRNCLIINTPTAEGEIVTNDVVELVSEKTFRLLGRIDNVINSGGVKVQAELVEKALEKIFAELQLDNRFFIAGTPDERLGEMVTLFVEGNLPFSLNALQEKLLAAKLLSKYELPRQLETLTSFPETPSGKIDRRSIRQTTAFQIRKATATDLQTLCILGRRTFQEAFADTNTPDDLETYLSQAFSADKIAAELQQPGELFFIAFQSGKPAGYAKLRHHNPYLPGEKAIELQRIYVLSDFQGMQAGKKLLDCCLQLAETEGFEWVWLGVWEHNPKALRFYEKNGFEVFSSHVFRVGTDDQTDLLMKKRM